jgi:hypothetical protein
MLDGALNEWRPFRVRSSLEDIAGTLVRTDAALAGAFAAPLPVATAALPVAFAVATVALAPAFAAT